MLKMRSVVVVMVQFLRIAGQVDAHSEVLMYVYLTLDHFYAIIMILMLIYTELLSPLEQIHSTDVETDTVLGCPCGGNMKD